MSNMTTLNIETSEDINKKLDTLLSIAEECVSKDELYDLIKSGKTMVFYDGFEPSGRIHIAQGILRAINVNKITSIGNTKFIFYVADLFAQLNHKLGSDINKIREAGKLMIETWRAVGMNMENVEFIWASEEIAKRPTDYLKLLVDVSTKFTIGRIKKCAPALGRDDIDNSDVTGLGNPDFIYDENGKPERVKSDEQTLSTLLYSAMQVSDIPFLKVDIASLGMDQRKILVINRELAQKNKQKHPPILLMHHMLLGLDGSKMSKSNPDNAIFMDDSINDVKRKINKAHCPEKDLSNNPITELVRYIIFPAQNKIEIFRDEKYGGNLEFTNISDFEKAYTEGQIFPLDLKINVIRIINSLLEPVRQYFKNNPELMKLAEKVKSYQSKKN